MTFYSFFSLVRSTFTYTWVVEIPTDKSQEWISKHDYGLAQLILNSIGLFAGLISIVLIMYRIREQKIERVSALASGCSFVQCNFVNAFMISRMYIGSPRHVFCVTSMEFRKRFLFSRICSWSRVCISVIICRHIVSHWLHATEGCTKGVFWASAKTRVFIFCCLVVCHYRGLSFRVSGELELWRVCTVCHCDALDDWCANFAEWTHATIGYGNFSPSSDVTKIILIVYASFGLVVIGFFVIAIGDAIVEKAERQLQFQVCWLMHSPL